MSITKLFFGLLIVVLSSVFTSSVVYADRIIHKTSGKCVHPKGRSATPGNNTNLVVHSNDCKTADVRLDFFWSGSNIKHAGSNKCVHPRGGSSKPRNNTPLVLYDCGPQSSINFRQLPSGHIQHIDSGKCVHPKGGSPNPRDDTQIVLDESCFGDRIGFSFVPLRVRVKQTGNKKLILPLSAKCVHPQGRADETTEGTKLVIHSADCAKADADKLFFTMNPNGSIEHNRSGKCIVPTTRAVGAIRNNTGLMLVANCSATATQFSHLPSGSLQHVSGKCIHPRGGSQNPRDNTPLVLYDTCDAFNTKFVFK